MHSAAPGSPLQGTAKSSVLLRGTANGFGGRRQAASSTSHVRIQAGVPGIGVKLALCELEHLLETVKPERPAVNCTDYDLQLEFS